MGFDEADLIDGTVLVRCRLQNHELNPIVDDGQNRQLFMDLVYIFGTQHIHAECLFEMPEIGFNFPSLCPW